MQVPQRREAVQPHNPEVPLAHPNLQRRRARAASASGPSPPALQLPTARPAVGAVHDEFPDEHAAYVIFTSQPEGRRSRRREHQGVNVVATNPAEHMHWSEKPISWSRADHPEVMPSPGSYALVLGATLATERRAACFSRVLIDGGSSINILYRDTLEKLNVKTKQLMPTRTVFHGIVPGHR